MTAQHSAKPAEPVLSRAAIVTVIAVLSALLVKAGLGDVAGTLDRFADPIADVVLAVAPLVAAVLARRHVTPVADPRDDAGNKLTPDVPAAPLALTADEVAALAALDVAVPAATA